MSFRCSRAGLKCSNGNKTYWWFCFVSRASINWWGRIGRCGLPGLLLYCMVCGWTRLIITESNCIWTLKRHLISYITIIGYQYQRRIIPSPEVFSIRGGSPPEVFRRDIHNLPSRSFIAGWSVFFHTYIVWKAITCPIDILDFHHPPRLIWTSTSPPDWSSLPFPIDWSRLPLLSPTDLDFHFPGLI